MGKGSLFLIKEGEYYMICIPPIIKIYFHINPKYPNYYLAGFNYDNNFALVLRDFLKKKKIKFNYICDSHISVLIGVNKEYVIIQNENKRE